MNLPRSHLGMNLLPTRASRLGEFDPTPWIDLTEKGVDLTVKTVQAGKTISDTVKKSDTGKKSKKKAKKSSTSVEPVVEKPATTPKRPFWLIPVAAIGSAGLIALVLISRRPVPVYAPASALPAPARVNPYRRRRKRRHA